MHPCKNARINTSVISLNSCKKWAPKHKYFKSYGELGIGSSKLFSATLSRKVIIQQWANVIMRDVICYLSLKKFGKVLTIA